MWASIPGTAGIGTASTINAPVSAARVSVSVSSVVASKPSATAPWLAFHRPVVAEHLTTDRRGGPHHRAADESQPEHAHRCLRDRVSDRASTRASHSPRLAQFGWWRCFRVRLLLSARLGFIWPDLVMGPGQGLP